MVSVLLKRDQSRLELPVTGQNLSCLVQLQTQVFYQNRAFHTINITRSTNITRTAQIPQLLP